jgi:hypothetical protein
MGTAVGSLVARNASRDEVYQTWTETFPSQHEARRRPAFGAREGVPAETMSITCEVATAVGAARLSSRSQQRPRPPAPENRISSEPSALKPLFSTRRHAQSRSTHSNNERPRLDDRAS